eukprot:TRINITY_DN91542_c0_g1_i1.p2 TRINITY_DN91542_c0_g1~~TRINITY_DN91542_c0_g1_i1.p2  ORF type:complete len:196 (+),score=47.13 TRINITY_DN91542_c0_g1_i1:179-766(+)
MKRYPGHDLLFRLGAVLLLRASPPGDPTTLRHWAEANAHSEAIVHLRMFLGLVRPRRRLAAAADLSEQALHSVLNDRGLLAKDCPRARSKTEILSMLKAELAKERRAKKPGMSRRSKRTKRRRILLDSDGGGVDASDTEGSGKVQTDVTLEVTSEIRTVQDGGGMELIDDNSSSSDSDVIAESDADVVAEIVSVG